MGLMEEEIMDSQEDLGQFVNPEMIEGLKQSTQLRKYGHTDESGTCGQMLTEEAKILQEMELTEEEADIVTGIVGPEQSMQLRKCDHTKVSGACGKMLTKEEAKLL
jgi:hypothetical protein